MYVPEQATTLTPYDLYPTTPHTTFYVRSALSTGLGRWGPYVHAGNPGKYGVVAVSDGVRSAPLIFNVVNKLAGGSIEITTEPDPYLLPWRAFLVKGRAHHPMLQLRAALRAAMLRASWPR